MGQTIWFRCIHIYIEIVVANCVIIEAKFSGRLWEVDLLNENLKRFERQEAKLLQ
jgi:hypothetical protein